MSVKVKEVVQSKSSERRFTEPSSDSSSKAEFEVEEDSSPR